MIDPLVRTVLNMMGRFGGDATLVAQGVPVYDPATSTVVTSEASKTIRVMAFDYMPKTAGMTTENNTLIQAGDKQFFVKPSGLTFTAGTDRIVFQNKSYNVVAAKEINPSGSNVLLHEVYGRA